MAVDEAILESTAAGNSPPTMRLYAWSPACLSLGLAQPAADVDQSALDRKLWSLVRRPTGGRAILHTDELTYALISTSHHPIVSGGVLESYNRIAKALIGALQHLALSASADALYPLPPGSQLKGPVCFEVPSNYEITVTGKKLIGSAQARRKDGFLQHGTLPLFGDLARITAALSFPTPEARAEAANRLLDHATTVERVLGIKISWQDAADAFETGFRETFEVDLLPGELTANEEQRAQDLLEKKYANPEWTFRV